MVTTRDEYFDESGKDTTKDSFSKQKNSSEDEKNFNFPFYGSIKAKSEIIAKVDVKK